MAREMKDSGIEWIGEIPSQWDIIKNKNIFIEVNELNTTEDAFPLLSVSEYYGVALKSEKIKDGEYETRAESIIGYKICRPKDLVFNIMLTWKRALGLSEYSGVVSPAYCVYRSKSSNIFPKYYHYLFRTDQCADEFKRYSTGIIDSRLRLYPDVFFSLKTLIPPYTEQVRIASYLDSRCAEIDKAVEATKASIEEYKKLRQAIITEAVTTEDIPRQKFKYCAIVKANLVHPEDYQEMYQVAPDNIEKDTGRILFDSVKSVKECGVISDNHLFYKGQILYSKIRPILNKVTIAPFDGLCCADMYPIETNNNTKYLVYSMLSADFLRQVKAITEERVKMPKINQEELGGIIIGVPSISKQEEIVEVLDSKCSEIDSLIKSKEKLIEELTAYRKSLIFEYVTGKKEVPAV